MSPPTELRNQLVGTRAEGDTTREQYILRPVQVTPASASATQLRTRFTVRVASLCGSHAERLRIPRLGGPAGWSRALGDPLFSIGWRRCVVSEVGQFLTTVLTSSVIAGLIAYATARRTADAAKDLSREERLLDHFEAAREALSSLRSAYRKAHRAERDAVDNDELEDLGNAFDAAINACDNERIRLAAVEYREIGIEYASGSEDVNVDQEKRAYDKLQKAINIRSKRFGPKA